MTEIRYASIADIPFWLSLDRHIGREVLKNKLRDRQAYILLDDGLPAGLLRYNLFWDSIPFCTMLFIIKERRGRGLGKGLMSFWEGEMRAAGHGMAMTSTRADEGAQHFYRRLGYKDSGGLLIDIPKYAQPAELFFIKPL